MTPSYSALAITAVCALGALGTFSAYAQVHRCTDASGKMAYSDLPCPANQAAKTLESQRSQGEVEANKVGALRSAESTTQPPQGGGVRGAQPQRNDAPLAVAQSGARAAVSESPACRAAQKELEFVTSIRTIGQDEKRMRANAAIAQVNASCGTNTPLMQEPPTVVPPQAVTITHCDTGFCYDTAGALYKRTGPASIIGPTGRSCTLAKGAGDCP
ncbi:DUF4124 domain-containing protein [Acidovorax sp. GBBC 3334]|uniref:DUF4124 domain-containing protein n=1 Tax=Acidovorax sp. GBBC 3334 TaxID=2940496 RepID=UPI0023038D3C|nr:DUF4124 domain-containing protein [Acidovorax sp. GBBC 3334]MDA8454291.1 DUF4124 domain-containing protein [Acidovorax sp. GBBC 3334]